ncbi:MAG TPA: plastocyanin/azurin family copper-binding protein [Solirubrobacteraceae bacterium]|nr:plastocyanin/azurin family copper-binding protein [Solirubrobacteraceae bacterium]
MGTTPYKIAAAVAVAVAALATAGAAAALADEASPARAPGGPPRAQPAEGASAAQAPPVVAGAPAGGGASAPEAGAAPGAPPRVLAVSAQGAKPTGASHRHGRARPGRSVAAHAAGGTSVTIRDFSFGPSAITVHAGDTVTWVNEGHANHTATAPGLFDTGILHTGQSASQTFTHAGTFSYRCSVHPFMRAVVTVLPASATGNGTSGPAGGSGSGAPDTASGSENGASGPASGSENGASGQPAQPASAAAPAQRPTLPATGFDTREELVAGLAMLLLGGMLLAAARAARAGRVGAQDRAARRRR